MLAWGLRERPDHILYISYKYSVSEVGILLSSKVCINYPTVLFVFIYSLFHNDNTDYIKLNDWMIND